MANFIRCFSFYFKNVLKISSSDFFFSLVSQIFIQIFAQMQCNLKIVNTLLYMDT